MRTRHHIRAFVLSLATLLVGCLLVTNSAVAAFGVSEFGSGFFEEGGAFATRAGGHPFAQRTVIALNEHFDETLAVNLPDGNLKDLTITQPLGFAGNVNGLPKCRYNDFLTIIELRYPACPDDTAVGVETTKAGNNTLRGAVYDLSPGFGSIARLGFLAYNTPVVINVGITQTRPYRVVATIVNVPETSPLFRSSVELWGNPASPVHDAGKGTLFCGKRSPGLFIRRA